MINEIKSFSGGAQVQVLADRKREYDMDESAIVISGTMTMKAEAASFITEKITLFQRYIKVFY